MREIVLPAKTAALYEVLDFVRCQAQEAGMSTNLPKLELVAEEVFVNIAQYAYLASQGEAQIQCEVQPGLFLLRFIDSGVPFDMTKALPPDINMPAEQRPVGGLGIYLVKQTMQTIHYAYQDGKNILTLGMKIEPV